MELKRKLLRILIEFRFTSMNDDELIFLILKFRDSIKGIEDFELIDWREKLLFSFYCGLMGEKKHVKLLIHWLLEEYNGKQIKGYIITLIHLCDKKEIVKILERYNLIERKYSFETNWIKAAVKIINNEDDIDSRELREFKKALKLFHLAPPSTPPSAHLK